MKGSWLSGLLDMRSNHIFPVLTGIFILSALVACNEPNLDSNWKSPAISSDQPDSVWASSSVYSLEGKNILIGLENDGDNLYVLLKAENRETQAGIMRAGLTVWLDATGKKNKTFGVHYPSGMRVGGMFRPGESRPGEIQEQFRGLYAAAADTMEIIGPGKNERSRVSIENATGLSVMANNDGGTITYELRVPIRAADNSGCALNITPGKAVGLGLETGTFEAREPNWRGQAERTGGERGGGFGRGGFGGGVGGREGRGAHRGGGRPPGERNRNNNLEPLEFWAKVRLASASINKD
jgi:hypothetical protein